jgi:hypothetical protein
MISALQKALLATGGLLPLFAGAAVPDSDSAAVHACAGATAWLLGSRLATTHVQTKSPDPVLERALLGVPQKEIVVAAHDHNGRVVSVMACTVDATDDIVSLRPASPDEKIDADLKLR